MNVQWHKQARNFKMLSSKQNYHQCDSVHYQEGWYLPQKSTTNEHFLILITVFLPHHQTIRFERFFFSSFLFYYLIFSIWLVLFSTFRSFFFLSFVWFFLSTLYTIFISFRLISTNNTLDINSVLRTLRTHMVLRFIHNLFTLAFWL